MSTMLKIKAVLAKILNWAGLQFDWSEWSTNNTTDTWVPVDSYGKIQHRIIPAMLGTKVTSTIQLANTVVESVTQSSVDCIQLNATEYLCEYTVRINTTQARTSGSPVCRFLIGDKVLAPKANCYNFTGKVNNAYNGGWWNGSWLVFAGTWNANTVGELYGSYIGTLVNQ